MSTPPHPQSPVAEPRGAAPIAPSSRRDPYRGVSRWYDRVIDPWLRGLKDATVRLAPPTPRLRVLDLGCGTGTLLERYARGGATVTGVDPSEHMLRVARRRLGREAHLLQADAARLPFPDASFDLVTATMVLHELLPEPRTATLVEAIRVLRPTGHLLVLDYAASPVRFPMGWLERGAVVMAEWSAGKRHFAGYRHFVRHGGLLGAVADFPLRLEEQRLLGDGNFLAARLGHSPAPSVRPRNESDGPPRVAGPGPEES